MDGGIDRRYLARWRGLRQGLFWIGSEICNNLKRESVSEEETTIHGVTRLRF